MKRVLRAITRRYLGLDLVRYEAPRAVMQEVPAGPPVFDFDGLRTIHNHDFLQEPEFKQAYDRSVQASGTDYQCYWRVYTALWAAHQAATLPGDFVECGVNYGFISSAILKSLDWASLDKTFYLIDTYAGLDERLVSEEEKQTGHLEKNREWVEGGFYNSKVEAVQKNFSEWPRARVVQGSVPDVLATLEIPQVAYLHLDMNCAQPEIAAIEHFWPRVAPGGVVLLDDYAYYGFQHQKTCMDAWAKAAGVRVLGLPTGQGLLIKQAQG